jgi:hypothetical protein
MCGIVHNPTRQKNFAALVADHPNLQIAKEMVKICEETDIPEKAALLLLGITQVDLSGSPAFSFPFALYEDGKRFVSPLMVEYEEAVLHLAMAGSTLYYINQGLAVLNRQIVMGHCCEIRYHDTSQAENAMSLAHDDNIYRADKLRLNPETIELTDEGFFQKTSPEAQNLLTQLFFSEQTMFRDRFFVTRVCP